MTKRDIADIVLVWMAVSFIFVLLTTLLGLATIIGLPQEATKYMATSVSVAIVIQVFHLLVVSLLSYVLLFKRNLLLNMVFPNAEGKELSVSEGLSALTSYAFWIRLLGIFTLLSSGIKFLVDLVRGLAINKGFKIDSFLMFEILPEMVSAFLAFLLIWKADWIASRLGKLGSSNRSDAGDG